MVTRQHCLTDGAGHAALLTIGWVLMCACGVGLWCQVMQEVTSFLKMLDEVYGIFGLDYTMALSTRPESYLGEDTYLSTLQHSTPQHSASCGKKQRWVACCRCWCPVTHLLVCAACQY